MPFDDRRFFATAAKGTEVALRDELRALHFRKVRADRGGVHFEGEVRFAHRACLELRTAMRVLEELATFPAPDGDALYEGVRAVDFAPLVRPEGTLAVRASLTSSALTHSQFVAQRVKDAVVDRLRDETGARPSVDKDDPDLGLFVRIKKDEATLYADLSGQPLHLRGYRGAQREAPLKETLAASLLLLAGYTGDEPFVDPMCGSGTLAIEAAMMGQGIAPGLLVKRFGFERWPRHGDEERKAVTELRDKLRAARHEGPDVLASDLDHAAIEVTRANAKNAGVKLRSLVVSVEKLAPSRERRTIVTNPPYGERISLSPEQLEWMGRALAGAREATVGVLAGTQDIIDAIPRKPHGLHAVWNGDIECRFAVYAPR